MIRGFKFELHGNAGVQSVDDAMALIDPLLAADVEVAIYSITYNHVGEHEQSQPLPIGCTITGQAWQDYEENT